MSQLPTVMFWGDLEKIGMFDLFMQIRKALSKISVCHALSVLVQIKSLQLRYGVERFEVRKQKYTTLFRYEDRI